MNGILHKCDSRLKKKTVCIPTTRLLCAGVIAESDVENTDLNIAVYSKCQQFPNFYEFATWCVAR